MTAKELAAAVVDSLDREPDSWRGTGLTMTHESGLQLWNGCGLPHVWEPLKAGFGFFGAISVSLAIRRWSRRAASDMLKTK